MSMLDQRISLIKSKRTEDAAAGEDLTDTLGIDMLQSSVPPARAIGSSGMMYHGTSFCLRPGSEPRRSAIFLVEARWFDPLIMATILLNCFTMAWESPLDPEGTWKAQLIDTCEMVFLGAFTVELLAKVLAYGFGRYICNSWCQFDFVCVTLAWAPILFGDFGVQTSVLRAVRALRPLRILKRVPGMPGLIQAILSTVPKLGNVIMLMLFVSVVFAIFGVELFKGMLHYRCAIPGFDGADHHVEQAYEAERPFDTGLNCNPELALRLQKRNSDAIPYGVCPSEQSCVYFSSKWA